MTSASSSKTRPVRVWMVLKRPAGAAGLQRQARALAQALIARGVQCTIVYRRGSHEPEHVYSHIPVPALAIAAPSSLAFHLRLRRELIRRRGEYDVLHLHGFGDELLWVASAARRAGRPLLVKPSTAGPGTNLHAWARLLHLLPGVAAALFRGVSRWIAISAATETDLRRMGLPADRVLRMPNGVDTDRYRPLPADGRTALRAELGLAPAERVVVTVARLTPHKRLDSLVRAAARLRDRLPALRLWIVGRGPQQAALTALISSLGVGDRVALLGRLEFEDVLRRLQAADGFALVSRWEGLSNALLEAQAAALPAIVTHVSGSADVVRDGANGCLVPVDDDAALDAALGRLLGDDDWRARLGAAARANTVERFGIAALAERYELLYRELLGDQPGETSASPEMVAARPNASR